jgi:WD40 repeat protein
MSDVFISYSRKDIAFARLLHQALEENEYATWIDWQDIPPSTDWLEEVYTAIEGADTFLFVISQTSVQSEICELEIAHAEKNNKRLIPIVVSDVDPGFVHPSLAALNWIFFREGDEFHLATRSLIEAIQTDQVWVKEHTRLQVRALEWERNNFEKSYLLRGNDLEQAESWLSQAAEKDPKPTALQTQYMLAGRQEATRRQRLILGAVLVVLVISISLGVYAWTQRNQAVYETQMRSTAEAEAVAEAHRKETAESDAVEEAFRRATAQSIAEAASTQAVEERNEAQRQARLARSGFFSVEALSHMEDRLDLAMLLSVEAIQLADTLQSRSSLLSTLEFNPHLVRYLHGHAGRVAKVAFSPDGQFLITAGCAMFAPGQGHMTCGQGEILLWDFHSGELIDQIPTEHTTFMSDITFSADGTVMASSAWDGSIILWDVVSWEPLFETISAGTGRVLDLDFSPDGNLLISSHETMIELAPGQPNQSGQLSAEIRFWDVNSGEMIEQQQFVGQVSYRNVAFDPDGETYVTAMGAATVIQLWDVETRQQITGTFETYDEVAYSLAYSPDGEILALGNYDGSVILWDLESDQPIGEPIIGHTDNVNSLAFSPDGNILASSGSDKTIMLWDVESGQPIGDPLLAHTENVASVSFHPDGNYLASGSEDETVILWSLQEQSHIGRPLAGHKSAVWSIAYHPNGDMLVSASEDNTLRLWDTSGEPDSIYTLTGHDGHIYSVAFSPDGSDLVSGGQDGTLRFWDTSSGEQVGQAVSAHAEPVVSLAFSPDGGTLASGSMDKTIRLWDVQSRQPIGDPLNDYASTVNDLAFNPVGDILASASCADPIADQYCETGQIRLWELDGSEIISRTLRGHKHFIYGLAFSPDGSMLASASADKTIILWDVETGTPIGEPIEGHKEVVTQVDFSHDGKILASSSLDKTIILMDVATRQTIGQPLAGHQDTVTSLAFSPDDQTLASGSFDSTVILWDLDQISWLESACQRAGRNISQAEWSIYFSDEGYRKTCPEFPDA